MQEVIPTSHDKGKTKGLKTGTLAAVVSTVSAPLADPHDLTVGEGVQRHQRQHVGAGPQKQQQRQYGGTESQHQQKRQYGGPGPQQQQQHSSEAPRSNGGITLLGNRSSVERDAAVSRRSTHISRNSSASSSTGRGALVGLATPELGGTSRGTPRLEKRRWTKCTGVTGVEPSGIIQDLRSIERVCRDTRYV